MYPRINEEGAIRPFLYDPFTDKHTRTHVEVCLWHCINCGKEYYGLWHQVASDPNPNKPDRSLKGKFLAAAKRCPFCKTPYPTHPGIFKSLSESNGDDLTVIPQKKIYEDKPDALPDSLLRSYFKELATERREFFLSEAKEKADSYVEKVLGKYVRVPRSTAQLEPQTLVQYIQHLVSVEVKVYSLCERLRDLYLCLTEAENRIKPKKQELIIEIDKKIKKEEDEYKKISDKKVIVSLPQKEDVIFPPKPPKPNLLPFNEKMPQKPIAPKQPELMTANFFTKKKAEKQNAELTANYEKALLVYQQDFKNYEKCMMEYQCRKTELAKKNEQLTFDYQHQLNQYHETCKEIVQKRDALYEAALKVAQEEAKKKKLLNLTKTLDRIEKLKNQRKDIPLQIKTCPEQNIIVFLKQEIDVVKKMIAKAIQTREKLYDYDIIYKKYRNLVAITTFCEYLMSGRCSTLEGKDGAYNLYESEIRSNEIISKLTQIVASLEDIKANQFMLYQELKTISKQNKQLIESTEKVSNILTSIEGNTQELITELNTLNNTSSKMAQGIDNISDNTAMTAKNTSAIANNTAITAHYSKITAHYSKINAEIADAIGFMVALK